MDFKEFRKNKAAVVFVVLVFVIIFSAIMSSAFQNNFGTIDVRIVMINDKDGDRIVGKLYKPIGVDSDNPAPGILGLHGFNNDKDVERPAAIELAKAGFVVLALDELGHGDSSGGYTTDAPPYSYFKAYEYLMNLTFVQWNNTGIYGHSLGEIRARQVAAAYPQHRALGLQAFTPNFLPFIGDYGDPKFHNILHLWSSWEEWGGDGKTVAQNLADNLAALDVTYHLPPGTMAVDTTVDLWGGPVDFANGTARRESYDIGSHPHITMSPKHTSEIVAWMLQALQGMSEEDAWAIAAPANQTWLGSELFGMLAAFATLISILPLAYLLMNTRYFSEVRQPKPERINTTKKSTWWIAATANTAIAGITYWAFIPGYSNTSNWLFDVTIGDYVVFNHGIANGFGHWFLMNATLGTILWTVWFLLTRWRKGREGPTLHDVGLSFSPTEDISGLALKQRINRIPKVFNPRIIGKTILIAFILFGWMYGTVYLAQAFLQVEFRGFWTMMKTFSGLQRAVDFWPYFGLVFFFALINAGIYMFGQLRMKEYGNTYVTHAVWWFKICYLMLGGLVVVMFVQYGPQLFVNGPLTSTNIPGWGLADVNRMMIIQLMGAIPVFSLILFLSINLYRQTGRVYLSAIMFAAIVVWFQMTALVSYL